MEPAAPGTEEDIPILPGSFKKKENEQERLLSIKAKLPNGKYGTVFEHSIFNGSEHWYCNLCACPIMGRIYHHEVGKRHTSNMQSCGAYSENPELEDPEPPIQVAPGEPIPPGFEENVEKVARIQARLDTFRADPLIGLEYLFELVDYDEDKEPTYICTLCDKRGDPRTVISHLASYNHISQGHFIKCFRALAPYITKQYKHNWQTTMQKIADGIETKFGRLKPHVVEKELFERKRAYYQSIALKGPHFNERVGLTFEELIVKEELVKPTEDQAAIKQAEEVVKRNYRKTGTEPSENLKRSPSPPVVAKPKKPKALAGSGEKRRSLSSVSSISSNDLSDFDPGQQPTVKINSKENSNEQPPSRGNTNNSPAKKRRFNAEYSKKRFDQSEPPIRNRNNDRLDKNRGVLPWQRSDYRSREENPSTVRPKPKLDKHAEFKKLATAIEKDVERVFKQHEKHPEKHPQYNEEWKKFWNRRYKELQSEGKNPAGHDFKPEWIECWNKRLQEIQENDIKSKKDALRRRLGLAEEPAPICFRITGKKKPSSKDESKDSKDAKLLPMASAPDYDPDVIIIDDQEPVKETNSKRSHSPWEIESGRTSRRSREDSASRNHNRARNVSRPRNISRSRSRDRVFTRSRSRSRNRRSRSKERDWNKRDPYRNPREKMYYRSEYPPEYMHPPRVMRDVTRHPVNTPPPVMQHIPTEPISEDEDDVEINIVGALRLLTALEEKLGSLGPKVIDLLSQALAMEKTEANSAEQLLDNDLNCVMFETVKEKLKGQLLAGLVNYAQERAFKRAIKKIASLIYFAGERKRAKEREKPKMDPIKVPGIGTVDKSAIAKQIAAALIVQGKTDVTQAELEQLINAVVGMAEASQATNKPITTASFLQQLTQPKQAPVAEKPDPTMASFKQVLAAVESAPSTTTANSMEGLSDSDLQTLLQNFKDLCTDEQHSLISYLKKLEAREPERVERLRKFVNLEAPSVITDKETEALFEKSDEETNGRVSPFASRLAGSNPTVDEKYKNRFENVTKSKPIEKVVTIDSDDEDYTFEDVFKAANKNIRDKEEKEEKERLLLEPATVFKNEDFDLSNAKSLIANIMGQFRNKTESASAPKPVTNTIVVPPPKPPSVPFFPNFPNPNILDSINLANLANAISSAQKIDPNPPQLIQSLVSNPDNSSLQAPSRPNQPNLNPNNSSLQTPSRPNQPNPNQNNSFPQAPLRLNQPNPNNSSLQAPLRLNQPNPNINNSSLQAPSRLNQPNPNPNNFSLKSHSQQNQPYPVRHAFPPRQQQQFGRPNRVEPPVPPPLSTAPFMHNYPGSGFTRPPQPPKQFGQRPEYFDHYNNQW